jgi:hypothetical protein
MDQDAVFVRLQALVAQQQQALHAPTQALDRSSLAIELERSLETVEAYRVVSSHWPLEWHNLPTRFWSGVNRVVRRYLRWYIDPIVAQQNQFNNAVAILLAALAAAQTELRQQRQMQHAPVSPVMPSAADEAALHETIAARAAQEPLARFPDLELLSLLDAVVAAREVQAHWPLVAHTPYEQALVTLHKLVRRYLRWYINPLVAQQNAYNAALCQALAALVARDAEVRAEVAAQRAQAVRPAG